MIDLIATMLVIFLFQAPAWWVVSQRDKRITQLEDVVQTQHRSLLRAERPEVARAVTITEQGEREPKPAPPTPIGR